MRLLNTHTLTLTTFPGPTSTLPPFAILSHTWSPSGGEITLADVLHSNLLHAPHPPPSKTAALAKLHGCCRRARLDGYAWTWIDTCCIDQSSSAELSEAINSMFSWYQAAGVCYAYLADVSSSSGDGAEFRASRWFTRGWTLQELLAPERVEFFSRGWVELGTRRSLEGLVGEATGIEVRALRGGAVRFPAATKMRWAAGRRTTREEDGAYCLLGLFNVNMPLLYGEGARAFQRLQEEIVRNEGDYTILAWPGGEDDGRSTSTVSALAESPAAFKGAIKFPGDIGEERWEGLTRQSWGHLCHYKIRRKSYTPPMVVSLGLLLTLPVRLVEVNPGFKRFLVSTECAVHLDGRVMVLCIDLRADDHTYIDDLLILQRVARGGPNPSRLQAIDEADLKDMSLMRMYLPRPRDRAPSLGLGRQLTNPARRLLQLLLPAPPSPGLSVTVTGTTPELTVTAAPANLHNGGQPPDSTFYQLTCPAGTINISVPAPDGPRFSVLYRASIVRRQSGGRAVRLDPNDLSVHIVGDMVSLEDAMADEGLRTDRAVRSFPEHGLQIRASIKVVPVDLGDGGGNDGAECENGSPIGLCARVAIDACLL